MTRQELSDHGAPNWRRSCSYNVPQLSYDAAFCKQYQRREAIWCWSTSEHCKNVGWLYTMSVDWLQISVTSNLPGNNIETVGQQRKNFKANTRTIMAWRTAYGHEFFRRRTSPYSMAISSLVLSPPQATAADRGHMSKSAKVPSNQLQK
jgi:hypothetical protein